jgi:murein L,D-transpeptidase YcbB/YkuD
LTWEPVYSKILREHLLTSPGLAIFRFFLPILLFPLSSDVLCHSRPPNQHRSAFTVEDVLFQVQQTLRAKTDQKIGAESEAGGDVVLAPDLVRLFYAGREYRPAWIEERQISPQVQPLLESLKNIESEGLEPSDYHLLEIEGRLKNIQKVLKKSKPVEAGTLADFDLLCSDAFLACAGHLARGKVNPETHTVAWQGRCIEESLAKLLEDALAENRVAEALESLPPRHSFFRNLKTALGSYRELVRKTKWDPLPESLSLKKGDKQKEVKELRKRLLVLRDLAKEKKSSGQVFDDALEAALCRFQGRHGLEITGSLDPPALAALNVPLEARCRQIEANLERWRWLPHDLGERFIYVNVANFELQGFEDSKKGLVMKIVAGSEAWQTPDFASEMTHLVINPDWTIPIPVLLKETHSYALQNPCYFRDNRMVILRGSEEQQVEFDPASIDWARLTEKNLDFLVRQKPGPDNILGRLKFVFPNKYEIFLHDTPYQEDFAKAARAFSHGCIRAERPIELAVWVLRGKPGWDLRQILAAIDTGDERTVRLAEPVAVYFLDNTAWAEEDGTIQFRADIYERDKKLIEALGAKPPSPSQSGPDDQVPN